MRLDSRSRGPSRAPTNPRTRLAAEPLGDRVLPAGVIAVGNDPGPLAAVRMFADSNGDGTYDRLVDEFQPFAGARGGVRVAMGDFDGDGSAELVTAMARRGVVKVWDVEADGTVGNLLDTLTLGGASARVGFFVAAGDLNGDGKDELAVAQGSKGNVVRVYSDTNGNGLLSDNLTDGFRAFASGPKTGVRVAFGDTNGDGRDELLVARGPGARSTVRVFGDADQDRAVSDDPLVESFRAFGGRYAGGVTIASGPIAGAGGAGAEVIVGRETGRAAVRVFSDTDASGRVGDNAVFDAFLARPASFTGGVRVAAGDVNGTPGVEVITADGPGGTGVQTWSEGPTPTPATSDNAPAPVSGGFANGQTAAFGTVKSTTTGPGPVPIPPGQTITSTITLGADAGEVADVDVNLDILHDLLGQGTLTITLEHDVSGTTITLLSGGALTGTGLDVRLSDEASTDLLSATPGASGLIEGVYNPAGAALLSAFDSLDASGDWVLTITNSSAAEDATLAGWSLNIDYAAPVVISFPDIDLPLPIPPGTTITSAITLDASVGSILDLDLNLNLTNSSLLGLGALTITLQHVDSGTTVTVLASTLLCLELDVRFSDEAFADVLSLVAGAGGLIGGVCNPAGSGLLGDFDGLDASGDWVLSITNSSLLSVTTLLDWSLDVTF
jgi:trimeric autotransporter adhesin